MAALSTSILVASLVGAGTKAAGAVISGKASKKAADIQVKEADRERARMDAATDETKQYLETRRLESQAAYAPYVQMGGNALAKMTRGMGLPAAPMGAPPGGPGGPGEQGNQAVPSPMHQRAGSVGAGATPMGGPVQPASRLLAPTGGQAVSRVPEGQTGGPAQAGPTVLMRDPIYGRVKAVPARKVELFKARGATVVESPDAGMAG